MLQNTAVKQQLWAVSSFKKRGFFCMTGSLTQGRFHFKTGTSFGFLPKAGTELALANSDSLCSSSPQRRVGRFGLSKLHWGTWSEGGGSGGLGCWKQ